MTDSDIRFMQMALGLGRRGLGQTWPNPSVGCVIVQNNRVVGRGWTAPGGRPHAETQALEQAAQRSNGATAYVTLEPCAHQGQTPPCALALINAGITRVVVATRDPDSRVNGAGLAMLRDAGLDVTTGVLETEARKDLAGFFNCITHKRPFVTLKLASSFDGKIATKQGDSQWITGAESRRYVHALRRRSDAVLVGGGTARADDPTLTVRDMGPVQQPVRIVLSRHLDLPAHARLLQTTKVAPVWLCHGPDAPIAHQKAWANAGARLIPCATTAQGVDLQSALTELASLGLTSLFCEGGGTLAASLVRADLVDEIIGFTAGVLIGSDGLGAIGALGLSALSEAPRFNLDDTRILGGDVLHVWRRQHGSDTSGP